MKLYTLKDIDDLKPCSNPRDYVSEGWSGTLLDILNVEKAKPEDRIWVVTQLLDDKTNKLFAVWCAREALNLVEKPDPRSVNACDVAERFANGEAKVEELAAARTAAWTAAWTAARATARAAAWSAAEAAAWTIAEATARATAWAAARAAAGAAEWYAAETAAREKQIEKLKEMK